MCFILIEIQNKKLFKNLNLNTKVPENIFKTNDEKSIFFIFKN